MSKDGQQLAEKAEAQDLDASGSSRPLTTPERERLRTTVNLAAEAIPLNWPMRTFISRSPLMGFEHVPFDQAVSETRDLFGGEGYLSCAEYRLYYERGRISRDDLIAALRRFDPELQTLKGVGLGSRTLKPEETVLLHLIHGIEPLDPRSLPWKLVHEEAARRIRADVPDVTRRHLLSRAVERVQVPLDSVGREYTIAEWIERVTLVPLPARIIDSIPEKAQQAGAGAATGDQARADLNRLLRALGIPRNLRERYVTCVERRYDGLPASSSARRLDRTEFVLLWVQYERRFLELEAARLVGVGGRFSTIARQVKRDPERYYIQSLWSATLTALNLAESNPSAEESSDHPATPAEDQRNPDSNGQPHAHSTVAELLDRSCGSRVVEDINNQMITWCIAFVDEGMSDWGMPDRGRGFYLAWRDLARRDAALSGGGSSGDARRRVGSLPDIPEDALALGLRRLGIQEDRWLDYLRRHLAQLPGWAGYVRWRGRNLDYPEQSRHAIDPVEYLAVRLFYETHFAEKCYREHYGADHPMTDLSTAIQQRHTLERPDDEHSAVFHDGRAGTISRQAWRLFHFAQFFELTPEDVRSLSRDDAWKVLGWLDRFPPRALQQVWHEAYEGHYRNYLLTNLARSAKRNGGNAVEHPRPRGQAVFCIDVRSETFRRHLEAQGGYETVGFAGFFAMPLCYRSLDSEEDLLLCPVLIKPKHTVREGPRLSPNRSMQEHVIGERWRQASHHLLHELKASPSASYPTIDLLGAPFGVALVGKTLFIRTYRRLRDWIRRWISPPVPTRIPFEKFTEEQGDGMVAVGERALIAGAFRQHLDRRILEQALAPESIEEFRIAAIKPPRRGPERREQPRRETKVSEALNLTIEQEQAVIRQLREDYGVNAAARLAQLDRLSARGFTPKEQAFMVETALRLMSLTSGFARLVLICGHGSTTENNPYASALDCGACGGNHGGPNARVVAAMANKPEVRVALRERGVDIPDDTRFVAGQHDTTTDRVTLFDIEDLPESHRSDWLQLRWDLEAAGLQAARERCGRLPGAPRATLPSRAARHVRRRSADWAQIRPEWGLSNNAAFIIGRRRLTREFNLEGRTFLHNYDAARDESGKVLETIMTAPLVVAEWINLQYYFSAVDPWTYGSGTKVLHNVVSGIGVMLGRHSDLQTGLPLQTVNNGAEHYHEPLRLLAVIEATVERLSDIIGRHEILQRFFDNVWVHLVSIDPTTGTLSLYQPGGDWISPSRDVSHS